MQYLDKLFFGNMLTMANKVDLGFIKQGVILVKQGKIAFVGKREELPIALVTKNTEEFDFGDRYIMPSLIDCHTHIVYAGNRANEFEQKLQGQTYEQISQSGGGILSTVNHTREASIEELYQQSLLRVKELVAQGVLCLEIKSGYGLDLETEIKILKVAKMLQKNLNIDVFTTFLGAHALPNEFSSKDLYIEYLCKEVIPKVADLKLADAVDIYCENIAFNIKQAKEIFVTAKKHNLAIKCHAEQFSYLGASALAAKYEAISVDHLEFITENSIKAIKSSGTIAVLLPTAYYFLKQQKKPPIDLLKTYQVPMAIASDCNPGTSPCTSILLCLNMACTLFGLTVNEALLGITLNAAKALGKSHEIGSIETGKKAHLAVWDINQPAELCYYLGQNTLYKLIKDKDIIVSRET